MKKSMFFSLVVILITLSIAFVPVGAQYQNPIESFSPTPLAPPLGQPGLHYHYVDTIGHGEPYLEDNAHLYTPHGLAASGSSVWIAEKDGNRALQFGSNGIFLQKIGKAKNCFPFILAEFCSTGIYDIAQASDGNFWVSIRGQVVKIDLSGQSILTADRGYIFGEEQSLAVDASGRLYVSNIDYNPSREGKISVFDNNGQYLKTIGEGNDEPITFSRLGGINLFGNSLAVADTGNDRIVILDISDFTQIKIEGEIKNYQANSQPDNFHNPSSAALNASYIYVVDRLNQRIQVFDRNTYVYIRTLGSGGPGAGNDQWNYPFDAAVDASGNLYVSDEMNFRVKQFAPNLSWVRNIGQTGVPYLTDVPGNAVNYLNIPDYIAADSQGNLYAAERGAHQVMKIAPNKILLFRLGQAGVPGSDNNHFYYPAGLAVDSADNLYVADSWNDRIIKFNKDGIFLTSFGSSGSLEGQFTGPGDIAIDPTTGNIAVTDAGNNRVQVFSSAWTHLATFTQTNIPGTGLENLTNPLSVAVDSSGQIYIHDLYNAPFYGSRRVSKCVMALAPTCTLLFGQHSDGEMNFDKIETMTGGLAVDSSDRIYLTVRGWSGVFVYDSNGNFVDNAPSGFLPLDITFDAQGNLYVVSAYTTFQIDKFAPGLTDWRPVSVHQFGDMNLSATNFLIPYSNDLISAHGHSTGAELWSMAASSDWSRLAENGITDPYNRSIISGVELNGQLYVGTENPMDGSNNLTGAQLYRFDGTNWSVVAEGGFGTPTNYAISSLVVFKNALYAGTSRGDQSGVQASEMGAQIWRSPSGDSGSWNKVLDFEALFPGSKNAVIQDMQVFNNYLYVAVHNNQTGSELWRSDDGANFSKIAGDGLGFGAGGVIDSLEEFGAFLYLGGGSSSKAYIWRCQLCSSQADLAPVVQDGFNFQDLNGNGVVDNFKVHKLLGYEGVLYALTDNELTGGELWLSRNGAFWERLGMNPYDSPGGAASNSPDIMAVNNDDLYLGNWKIFKLKPSLQVFKTGTGDGTVTSASGKINCGASCWAVYTDASNESLTFTANPGSVIAKICFEGACYPPTVSADVHIHSLTNLTVEFSTTTPVSFLTVGRQGNGAGRITSNPAGIDCGATCQYAFPKNTLVSLTATASQGSFTGWSGDCTGIGVCQVTLSGAGNVVATFIQHPPQVASFALNGVKNQPITFTGTDFGTRFYDPDGDQLNNVKILSLPSNGSLLHIGNPVNIGQVIPFASLSSLAFQPELDFTGDVSFDWNASDGTAYAGTPAAVSLSIFPDTDGDSVGDAIEASAPPLTSGGLIGDGNGDGILDADQSNVASQIGMPGSSSELSIMAFELNPTVAGLRSDTQPSYFTLAAPAGHDLLSVRPFVYPPTNPASPEKRAEFPIGFVQFGVPTGSTSSSLTLELFYNGDILPTSLYAFGSTAEVVSPHWYEFMYDGNTGAVIEKLPNNKIKVTLHFIDGQRGDNDLAENGAVYTFIGPVLTKTSIYLPLVRR